MFYYKVYEPLPMLKPFISNYTIVESGPELEHHILPKAALILGIQYRGHMELSTRKPGEFQSYRTGLVGVQESFRTMRKSANHGMLAVNFTEAGASAFFKVPLHELYNEGYTLDLLVANSLVARLEEEVILANNTDARVRVAEAFMMTLLHRQEQDAAVMSAIDLIRKSGGLVRTEELARRLFLSTSRLEKRFRSAVGATPKKFASMVRIESILQRAQLNSSLTQLAYDSGYFDQAHFNRDFKSYTGFSPRQLFTMPAAATGELEKPCGFIYGSSVLPVHTHKL